MFKKLFLLLLTTIAFNALLISPSFAHKPHQDILVKNLKETMSTNNGISTQGLKLITENIASLNYEAHYSNTNQNLENQLSKIMSAEKFNASSYNKVMKKIFNKQHQYKDTSTNILKQLNQNDRTILFNVMKKLNLSKTK